MPLAANEEGLVIQKKALINPQIGKVKVARTSKQFGTNQVAVETENGVSIDAEQLNAFAK